MFFGSDFVTATKSDNASWDFLKPEIFAAIMDFYSSGQPLFLDSETAAAKDTAIHEVYFQTSLVDSLSCCSESEYNFLCFYLHRHQH